MSLDDSGLAIAEQATRALGSLERYGPVLRPTGTHELAWRLEMLDELARAGHRLAGAVARVVGDDPAVEGLVRELSSAIGLHCDKVVRAVRDRPGPASRRGAPAGAVQRAVIGTAAEVLMSRHDCGVDAAYATILERARDTGASTYEVAVRVVEEGGLVEEG